MEANKLYNAVQKTITLADGREIMIETGKIAKQMNPSTQDILEAVNKVPAETVIVLPNNKNIIMAAEQVDALKHYQETYRAAVPPARYVQ